MSIQTVTIRRHTYRIWKTATGPVVRGRFTPDEKRFLRQVYGVQAVEPESPVQNSKAK